MDHDVQVIALMVPRAGGEVLTASEHGYGKKTAVEEFPLRGRGGQGVIAMQCTERNGPLAGAVQVFEGDDVMLISNRGTLVRTRSSEISSLGRNTQGVMLIRLADDEVLVGIARIEEPDEEVFATQEESAGAQTDPPEATTDDAHNATADDAGSDA
jgi:DNA gyrase subunit A